MSPLSLGPTPGSTPLPIEWGGAPPTASADAPGDPRPVPPPSRPLLELAGGNAASRPCQRRHIKDPRREEAPTCPGEPGAQMAPPWSDLPPPQPVPTPPCPADGKSGDLQPLARPVQTTREGICPEPEPEARLPENSSGTLVLNFAHRSLGEIKVRAETAEGRLEIRVQAQHPDAAESLRDSLRALEQRVLALLPCEQTLTLVVLPPPPGAPLSPQGHATRRPAALRNTQPPSRRSFHESALLSNPSALQGL
jgi:hypothetical protein